ncbi:unnamed protein product [Musa acuminata subsp. malaccensis]|uniref:(wild Malaysian banana) hypothetical protein n=1 Tax=Musa acuminata subsp. malaccensis TaxID=214687 RepID=A0A804JZS4_MUSAM|nr:unnamed protein product [Musa acuminata subsp. malaccensis]
MFVGLFFIDTFFLFQLVHPPYQTKLGHIQSKTLVDFKEVFDKSFKREELFAIVAFDYTQSLMLNFDKICEYAVIEEANKDHSNVRDKI